MTARDYDTTVSSIDAALTDAIGLHGQWALTIETFDEETGRPRLLLLRSEQGTPWALAGMTAALADHIDASMGCACGDCDDDDE